VTFGVSTLIAAIGLVHTSQDWGVHWPMLVAGLGGMMVAAVLAVRNILQDLGPGGPDEREPRGASPEELER
jgi:hypothetical protein